LVGEAVSSEVAGVRQGRQFANWRYNVHIDITDLSTSSLGTLPFGKDCGFA